LARFTLRAAEEVRAVQFGMAEGELDAEMVAIAKAIITQRTGSFDPTTIVRTPRHHTSAALGGMPAKSCPLIAASDLYSSAAHMPEGPNVDQERQTTDEGAAAGCNRGVIKLIEATNASDK
jgi:hypothetical protein